MRRPAAWRSPLILNDTGPQIAPAALERIRSYVGKPPRFNRVSELETYFRQIYKPFGYLTTMRNGIA